MGKVKLTLTVDEKVVANAKVLAKKQHKSLSQLIEDMLVPSTANLPELGFVPSNALQLRGIAKGVLSRKTDKQIRDMMYKDRFGV